MRKKPSLVIAVFILLLTSCGRLATSPTPSPTHSSTVAPTETSAPELEAAPTLIALDYPNVDGSTSAHPLQVLLACRILGVPCAWQEGWALDKTRRLAPDPSFVVSSQVVEQMNSIWHSGTQGAYVNLIEGNAEFILVARLPSEDELQAAQESGVVLDVQAVALDAFVFLVNAENFDPSANVLWCKWTDVYWLKFGVTMLAKLVYN